MSVYTTKVMVLMGAKRESQISRPGLERALVLLNSEYENLYLDLFEVAPNHRRFESWTAIDIDNAKRRLDARHSAAVAVEKGRQEADQNTGNRDGQDHSNHDNGRQGSSGGEAGK